MVEADEWSAVGFSFVYFFCVLASYYVMRPVRDQLSAAAGSLHLPWFFAATFVATLILTPLFSWMVTRWPRRVVVPVVYVFFIGCLIAFVPFFLDPELLNSHSLGLIFFVWVSVFNLFVVSVFWSFMVDIWSDSQARRLFPLIALGGTFGAVAGPVITRALVDYIGIAFLLVIAAGLLAMAVICVIALGRWARHHGVHRFDVKRESAIGGSMWDGLRQIFLDPFIRQMALLMLLGDAIGTISYVLVIDYSGATFTDAIARTSFAASIDMITNILQAVVQLTITRWLLVRLGAGPVIGISAAVSVVACLGMALSSNPYQSLIGSMPWVAWVLIITRSLSHGMVQPARESLYTLVPRDLRYKGKNAVDTAVWRAGDVASSLSFNGLRVLGVTTSGFGFLGAGLIAASGIIGWRLANRVEDKKITG